MVEAKHRCVRCGHEFLSDNPKEVRCSQCRSRLVIPSADYNAILLKFKELEATNTPLITGLEILNKYMEKIGFIGRPLLTLSILARMSEEARRLEE